jgi:hypothetical protein
MPRHLIDERDIIVGPQPFFSVFVLAPCHLGGPTHGIRLRILSCRMSQWDFNTRSDIFLTFSGQDISIALFLVRMSWSNGLDA